MSFKTADLCDHFSDVVQIAEEQMGDFGGLGAFSGMIETVKAFEDNSKVRECVNSPGKGKVLVVDGGGSMRRAMLGDQLAAKAVKNGWAGIVINGCIRDSAAMANLPLGVKALNTIPLKSNKRNEGQQNIPVHFADIDFIPGEFVYCDEDGIIVSKEELG